MIFVHEVTIHANANDSLITPCEQGKLRLFRSGDPLTEASGTIDYRIRP